jgi:hypothetical protein
MKSSATVDLQPHYFTGRERRLLQYETLAASVFRYDSGVCAVRLKNELGEIVALPFQGQQIWSAQFLGRTLTMKSMFSDPRQTRDYLSNYGGFLLHCGATAMGTPSAQDTHPLHGELPNALYQKASIQLGEDEQGVFLGLGGEYQHTIAFSINYAAQPLIKLYAGSSLLKLAMRVTNLAHSDMPLMYLAHVNFRPVDQGRLVYSAIPTPDHVRVRTSIPAHIQAKPGYREFIEELALHPEQHHVFTPGLAFDPEVVFFIDYLADSEGWAHSLQVHPDGSADYIRHRPQELSKGVRWICRTADQDALGIVLPATAEPEGYLAEQAKGNVRRLGPGETFACQYDAGALEAKSAKRIEELCSTLVR